MIGPPGYGDARFISLKTPLNYKIRFENDPNATAPAQNVIILHTLDQDLDIRTFRIRGFGFGNFTKTLSKSAASIQVRKSDRMIPRSCTCQDQEKIRGQRARLQVQALGYVNSTKVIFSDISRTEVCFPRRPH